MFDQQDLLVIEEAQEELQEELNNRRTMYSRYATGGRLKVIEIN